jgi:NADP-dependent 3-hydroxy acid dehydrogenase YdfG
MPGIRDKVVAITGASSGIGEATARLLAEGGAKVAMGARRTDRLTAIAADIRQQGGTADYLTLDVTDRRQMVEFVSFAQKRFGRLDVIINNAGLSPVSRIDDLKVDEWESMVEVNIKGVLYGIAAALPVFRQQDSGHVINIASLAGIRVRANMAIYAGTKFAVRAISEGLRQEAGGNLRVTIISPGMVESEVAESSSDPEVKRRHREARAIAIPAASIARAIAFAISEPAEVDVNEIVVRPTLQPF